MNVQTINLAAINSLDEDRLQEAFLKCSGSAVWADQLTGQRPFSTAADLQAKVAAAWNELTHEDWLKAFASHPKIGDLESLRKKFASTASWASNEQSGVNSAAEETLKELAEGNDLYEKRFGHIFIVCATGKTASEMLSLLKERLNNLPEVEFKIACNEQKKITQLRLEKLQP
jgi:2-oxo-4-hydroxy-4-carboxy-5-ureidoimidazoline decarboxylase